MELLNLEMEQHRQQQQQQIQWRRDKVQELSSKGHSQREIANFLKIGIGTVNRDLVCLRQQPQQQQHRDRYYIVKWYSPCSLP